MKWFWQGSLCQKQKLGANIVELTLLYHSRLSAKGVSQMKRFLKNCITKLQDFYIRYILLNSKCHEVLLDVDSLWKYHNAICSIKSLGKWPHHWYVGYVRFTTFTPLLEDYDKVFYDMIHAPGGITFCHNDPKGTVFGFDTYHAGIDSLKLNKKSLMQDVQKMVDSINILQNYYEKYNRADAEEKKVLLDLCQYQLDKIIR